MDSCSPKTSRRAEIERMEDGNDEGRPKFSELPDIVLAHILSFLPTKEAIRTSILSKKWEYLWTSIPKLHFECSWRGLHTDFVNIVDRSLQLRGSSDITSFYLVCDCDTILLEENVDIMPQIETWISDVVRFNVKDVELDLFPCCLTLNLPFSFVNCRTLTSLTIYSEGILEFPSPVCLSNLKKLELKRVEFSDEHSTQELFSGCPLLEDLTLERCSWESVSTASLFVVSPRLQYFTMIEDDEQSPPSFSGHEFVISSHGLKYFHYEGGYQFDFIVNSQQLQKVLIDYFPPEDGPITVIDHFLKFLRYTYNVPSLTLMNALCLLDIPEVLMHIPVFSGVRHLVLDYKTSDLSNMGLLLMLQQIPCLEFLEFSGGIKLSSDPNEDNILVPLPPCFLNSLRIIYIYIREGDDKDMMGVKLLLNNALVLEEMRIEFCSLVKDDISCKFCVELLKLPKRSKDCEILIKE